ncbi:MAG: histidine phosphatase family protein [Clostridia bacterium]|nr:histidine phosphatase family protein [Clostridia bacterium]
MLLFIIRHGDPIYNPDSLTPKGHEQAKALVRRFTVHGLDRIYSSPMIRAQQTAAPTAEALGLPVNIEKWCSEDWAYREMSIPTAGGGRTWYFRRDINEIRADGLTAEPKLEAVRAGIKRIGDSSDEFMARHGYVREGDFYRIEKPNDERVAVFCHEGFGCTWMAHLLSVPTQQFWTTHYLTHSAVSVFQFENDPAGFTYPKMLAFSDISHILGTDLPYEHSNSIPM